jgi:hypothetical protein
VPPISFISCRPEDNTLYRELNRYCYHRLRLYVRKHCRLRNCRMESETSLLTTAPRDVIRGVVRP